MTDISSVDRLVDATLVERLHEVIQDLMRQRFSCSMLWHDRTLARCTQNGVHARESTDMTDVSAAGHDRLEPSPWVARFLPGIAPGGHVLDVACGAGRHLLLALAQGHRVTGIDRDLGGVSDLAGRPDLTLLEADLEAGHPFPLGGQHFDGVVVTNYLWRPIIGDIVRAVADDGVLIYETFAAGHERHGKPMNPDFLLRSNELLRAALPDLVVVAYEHGVIEGEPRKMVQRIAACGPRHGWAAEVPFALTDSR